jgi:hypothetical protein
MPAHPSPESVDNELLRLILVAVPPDARGEKTIINAARKLGVTRMAIWKWTRRMKISPERAQQIVEMSEGRVSLEDLHRFVFTR